jgi:hypothetical protein
LAYNNAGQFIAAWDNSPSHQARDNLEQEAITRSPAQDVQLAATVKINMRLQVTVGQLVNEVNVAQGAAAASNATARQAQAAAQAAGNVDRFRRLPSMETRRRASLWASGSQSDIEDYLRTAPDADYIQLTSSYLEGGPRSLRTNVYEAHKRVNRGAEPANPRQFLRQTFEANYGHRDLDQKYWDTWNSLKMGPSQSITEYNVDVEWALTDLAGHVTDEQVKIEKYRAWLQHDLRQLCINFPAGTRRAERSGAVCNSAVASCAGAHCQE